MTALVQGGHRPFLGALALQFVLVLELELVLENTALSSRPRAVFGRESVKRV
ncbi:MAG: hypothetical protein V2A73_01115 [Pseudomonadota bacterium]